LSRLLDAPVRPSLREQQPEPARFWIRYAPRQWPGPPGWWLDLASGTLAGAPLQSAGGRPDSGLLQRLFDVPLDDVLYLPPVPGELAAHRDALAARHAGRGTPVVVQLLPGDVADDLPPGVTVVVDLTPVAVAAVGGGDESEKEEHAPSTKRAPKLASADAAAWPLLPEGLAPLSVALAALRGVAVPALQVVPLELDPRQLRELGEGLPEARYLALFHGGAGEVPAAVRETLDAGLRPLLTRPLPRPPLRGAGNLRLAGLLAIEGELALRLGAAEPGAQALLRAARFAERAPHDLEALAREGNLGVLPWLEGAARLLVESAVEAAGRQGGEDAARAARPMASRNQKEPA
jgi:hypothetical protein